MPIPALEVWDCRKSSLQITELLSEGMFVRLSFLSEVRVPFMSVFPTAQHLLVNTVLGNTCVYMILIDCKFVDISDSA